MTGYIRPSMIQHHTAETVKVIKTALREVVEDAEDLYTMRWVDLYLTHVSHAHSRPRRMAIRWPAAIRPGVAQGRTLELALRHLQLLGWQVYRVQHVLELGKSAEPSIEMDWVWSLESAPPTTP